MSKAFLEDEIKPKEILADFGLKAKILQSRTKIDQQGTPFTEYIAAISRDKQQPDTRKAQSDKLIEQEASQIMFDEVEGKKNQEEDFEVKVQISTLDFIDTLMYHVPSFNNVQRIPDELRAECDYGRQTGEDNSKVLQDFLNFEVF